MPDNGPSFCSDPLQQPFGCWKEHLRLLVTVIAIFEGWWGWVDAAGAGKNRGGLKLNRNILGAATPKGQLLSHVISSGRLLDVCCASLQ
jgi:hypothetical protein